jgi:uncharacterized membrane protein
MSGIPSDDAPLDLARRVERLEEQVGALQRALGPGAPDPTPAAPARPQTAAPARLRTPTDWVKLGEDWLGRIGVLLLLLGLAFLYRYAIDRGWITPELRVAFGLLLGGGLLTLGLRRAQRRPLYSQVLLGGAVAVLYLTGWAAQVLYELVPWAAGFGFMGAVTVLAVGLAAQRRHQVLAVIGVAGGLATPFLLEGPPAAVTGLVAYTVLLLGASGLLQLRRGWGVLLTVNVVGGLAAVAAAAGAAEGLDRVSAQAGIVAAWVVACAVPYLQGWLHLRDPSARPAPPGSPRAINRALLWVLGVGVSATAVNLTTVAWDLGRAETGAVALGVAALALAGSRLMHPRVPVARPALEAGALLLVAGTALLAGPEWLPLPVALVAAGLLWFSQRAEDIRSLRILAHAAFALLGLHYLAQLGMPGEGVFTPYPLGVLGAMAVAAASARRWLEGRLGPQLYPLLSYISFLAWLAWQLTPLEGGHGLTSTAWGGCAIILLAVGARSGRLALRVAGLVTLGAVAGKLLLVDLSALDAGLRILLFLGFGAVFLVLGYLFKGGDARTEANDG